MTAPPGWGDLRSRLAQHWSWAPLFGAFDEPGRVSPSDLDCILERQGRFLVFETKRPKEELRQGQSLLLLALGRLPEFSVFVVTGTPERGPLYVERVSPHGFEPVRPLGWPGLWAIARRWWLGQGLARFGAAPYSRPADGPVRDGLDSPAAIDA